MSLVTRLSLSIIILFHLIGILFTPNQMSFATNILNKVYSPYMSFLGINATFSFFAPEPLNPPMYLDYTIQKKEGMPESGRFPDEKAHYLMRDSLNRLMSLNKFILMTDDNVRNMFIRYMCITHPDMSAAQLWRVLLTQPTLEMVQRGEKKMTDAADYKIEAYGTFYCPEDLK